MTTFRFFLEQDLRADAIKHLPAEREQDTCPEIDAQATPQFSGYSLTWNGPLTLVHLYLHPGFFRLQLHRPNPKLRIAVGRPAADVYGLQVDVLQAAQCRSQVQSGGGIDGSVRHRTAGSNHSDQQLLKDALHLKCWCVIW